MAERVQTYKNHARVLPLFHFLVLPVLLVNLINSIRHVVQDPSQHFALEAVVALALLMTAFLSRVQPLAVQDRVIRLEMRLRLRGLLPPDMQPQINDLTPKQLVALRFASDAEMPELVRDVIGGKLTTMKEIKMRVKSWQADWLRA